MAVKKGAAKQSRINSIIQSIWLARKGLKSSCGQVKTTGKNKDWYQVELGGQVDVASTYTHYAIFVTN